MMAQSLTPYYLVTPEQILRDYIDLFREEYNIKPSRVIVLSTWSDSTHVFYEGHVIEGHESVTPQCRTISLEKIKTPLYTTEPKKMELDVGQDLEYDDQASFRICFYPDGTINNFLSYEMTTFAEIPALLKLEEKYQINTDNRNPYESKLLPFIPDKQPKIERDVALLSKEISDEIQRRGIYLNERTYVDIDIIVDTNGTPTIYKIYPETKDNNIDKLILDYMEEFVKTEKFIPGTHREVPVNALVGIPVLIEKRK